MDRHVKDTLKLIESDGDSLVKKAEMYFRQRPQLISHVEESYRMYRSLAERYDHLIGELKRNMPPDLSSHGSVGSDQGSEPPSPYATPEFRLGRHVSGPRAAGFDVFLGSGVNGGTDPYVRGDEVSPLSISDSEAESDVSSLSNYAGLEELHGKFGAENGIGSLRGVESENLDDLYSKLAGYEEVLKLAKEKNRLSDEEISNLRTEIESIRSLDVAYDHQPGFPSIEENGTHSELLEVVVSDPSEQIQRLSEELKISKGKALALEKELVHLRAENKSSSENIRELQDQLKTAQKNAATWKTKLESEIRHVTKMQGRIARYKASLTDRDNEVRELKDTLSDADKKYQLHAEISRLSDEKTGLEQKIRESELNCHNLETQHASMEKKLSGEIAELKATMAENAQQLETVNNEFGALKLKYDSLMAERDELNAKVLKLAAEVGKGAEQPRVEVEELKAELEKQKILTMETAEGKREAIRQLCFSLEHYRNGYKQLRQAYTGLKQHHPVLAS